MNAREHTQETPFGALFLHWCFTILMILVTINLSPADAYTTLVDIYSYTIVAVFGFAIAIGMLKLRFNSRDKWRRKSAFNPYFSVLSAFVFAIGSAYPIVATWIPPTGDYAKHRTSTVDWYTTPVVAWSILAFGVVWYLGFVLYASRRARNEGVEFQVVKVPEFERDPQPDGPPVQVHETVHLDWVNKGSNQPEMEMVSSHGSQESF
jgi:hypothetical protein